MYPSNYAYEIEAIIPIIVFYVVVLAAMLLMGLASYILNGIAIRTMSINRGLPNGILGFVPIARDYQLGLLAQEIHLGKRRIKAPGLWLVLAPIIYGTVFSVLGGAFMVFVAFSTAASYTGWPHEDAMFNNLPLFLFFAFLLLIAAVAGQLFIALLRYLVLHKIFSFYSDGQRPVFYLIIAMLVPMAQAILLFIHRNRPLTGPPVRYPEDPVAAFPPQSPADRYNPTDMYDGV